jgi:hypothetical protein
MKEKGLDNLQKRSALNTANICQALMLLGVYFLLDGRNIGCPQKLKVAKVANYEGGTHA